MNKQQLINEALSHVHIRYSSGGLESTKARVEALGIIMEFIACYFETQQDKLQEVEKLDYTKPVSIEQLHLWMLQNPTCKIVKGKALFTDEEFGYDRWKADQYSLGKGSNDCFIVVKV